MLKVHVSYHKDGADIRIVDVPFWALTVSYLTEKILCSQCNSLMKLPYKIQFLDYIGWRIISAAMSLECKYEKLRYRQPISNPCEVANKLWPDDDNFLCPKEACSVHGNIDLGGD